MVRLRTLHRRDGGDNRANLVDPAAAIAVFEEARDLADDTRYDAARRAIATANAILRPMPGPRARRLQADLASVEAAVNGR